MAQIFPRSANTIARVTLFGGVLAVALGSWLAGVVARAPWITNVANPLDQPVPFSHEHHIGEGFDCRYCHATVEISAFAGMPSTGVCMNCHSQIWSDSPLLAPVRESWRTGKPIAWRRVHDLPDFVFFDHSIHVAKGIGCSSCHGQMDRMPLTWKVHTLHMAWCLDCHRNPEAQVRPRDQVFSMDYRPPGNQAELGARLVEQYGIRRLTHCYACHR